MRTILKILIVSFLLCTTAEARNEYLNDGTNSCDQGSWEAYTEVRQNEYKTGSSAESQNQVIGLRWRKSIGPCLLYTSPSPRDGLLSRMPSSA